jgi:hypothetical protein
VIEINKTLATWKIAVFRPKLQTFEDEKPNANLSLAWWWMAFVGFTSILINLLIIFVGFPFFEVQNRVIPDLGFSDFEILVFIGMNIVLATLLMPISLFILSVILFFIAKLLGGQGSFNTQTYLLATFSAPLWWMGQVVRVIPTISWFVVIGLTIYQVYLEYLAIQVTHQLNRKRSMVIVLTPVTISLICVGIFAVVQFYFKRR